MEISQEVEDRLNAVGDEAIRFAGIWAEALESGKLEDEWQYAKIHNEGINMLVEGFSIYIRELIAHGYNDVNDIRDRLEEWLAGDCDPIELEKIGLDLMTFVSNMED